MDYDFFVKHLFDLTPDQLDRLRLSVTNAEYHRHPGFRQLVHRLKIGLDEPALLKVQQSLSPWFPVSSSSSFRYETYELIKLGTRSSVSEHSDICGAINNRLWMASHYHKIHIPLWTNEACTSSHRRSKSDPETVSQMAAGGVYAYNDYVWHSGQNAGSSDRVHICLAYFDPQWECRQTLDTFPSTYCT